MKVKNLFIVALLIFIGACSKDAPFQKDGAEVNDILAGKLSGTDAEEFLNMQSDGDFGFEWNGRVCGDGDLQFMGFIYDSNGMAIPYNGELYMGTNIVPQGGANVNYEYEDDPGDTLQQNLFINTKKDLKLTNPNDDLIFDTSIYIPDVAQFRCPLPCMNGNKCISFTSESNEEGNLSTYVVVSFDPDLPENLGLESSEDVHNAKKSDATSNEICMDANLFNNIPTGAYVSINIIRTNFFAIEGTNNKTYRLFSYVSQQGSAKYCP